MSSNGHGEPLRRVAVAVVGLVVVVGALGVGARAAVSWYRSATDPTRGQAEQLGYRLVNAGTFDPIALARVAQGRGGAEVLDVEGAPCHQDGPDVGCVTLLVRFVTEQQGWLAGSTPEVVVRCWRYTLRNSVDDHEPTLVDCPEQAEAISLPPEQPAPSLPDGLGERLRTTLDGLIEAGTVDVASVRAAVEEISGGPPAFVDVAVVDGNVGVVVGLAGQGECVAGRIIDQTTVETWTVPRVLAQPGEGGCGAGLAASGWSQHPPH
jgi:hypothetical protein